MSGVYRRITKPASPIAVYWNDANLQKIFDALAPAQQYKFQVNAFRAAGVKLKNMVIADAKSAGLGNQTANTNDGWDWQTFGRIPRSIKVGKIWKNGDIVSMRVFSARAKKNGFLNRAPHANLVVSGYRQRIPQSGVKGKGTTVASGETKSPRPIYRRANAEAQKTFVASLEGSLNRLIKKLNKQYAGFK